MQNGWYKITREHRTYVRWVEKDRTEDGPIHMDIVAGNLVEPVLILTQDELDRVINPHVEERIRV